ncbi:MAG: hypothetical protein U0Q16_17380 [Bryobacteraceae bacterium]
MLRRQFLASAALPAFARVETRSLVLVWLAGGVSQVDTWQPLPYTPFRGGMRAGDIQGTCRSIETSNPGLRFGEGLERLAEFAHLGRLTKTPGKAGLSHREATERALTLDAARIDFPRIGEVPELVARGARDVIIEFHFEPFQGFDVHDHGSARMNHLKRKIDGPLANLIRAVDLTTTTVVITSEFDRKLALDPNAVLTDESQYGYHAHAPESRTSLIFGAHL